MSNRKIMSEKLTELQAFEAMKKFLEGYWERTNSDDIGGLLGELQFSPDGRTFDPAAWHDWIDAVGQVLKEK
jgi:hypothetical protein